MIRAHVYVYIYTVFKHNISYHMSNYTLKNISTVKHAGVDHLGLWCVTSFNAAIKIFLLFLNLSESAIATGLFGLQGGAP